MKNCRLIFLCLTLPLIWGSSLPAQNNVIDVAASQRIHLRFTDKGQTKSIETIDQKDVLRVSWDTAQAPWCEFGILDTRPLPRFEKAQIIANVFFPENTRVLSVNLRLVDAHNEVFQIDKPIPANTSGWQKLVYDVDIDTPPALSWGANKNKTFDPPLRIAGFGISFKDSNTTGSLSFSKIEVNILQAPPTLSLQTGNPIHIAMPGQEEHITLKIQNPSDHPVKTSIHISRIDAEGSVDPVTLTAEISAHAEQVLTLPKPEIFGVYEIFAVSDLGGKEFVHNKMSYAFMKPAGPSPGKPSGFLFGICAHPEWYEKPEQNKIFMAAALCGAKVLRIDARWRLLEPEQGKWTFQAYDHIFDLADKYGIELAPLLNSTPNWAYTKERPNRYPVRWADTVLPDYAAWENFVNIFIERYHTRISTVEIWNEPDLLSFAPFDSDEYVQLLKIAKKTIKAIAPQITVLNGGLAAVSLPDHASSEPQYLQKVVSKAKDIYEIFAFHGHGSFEGYASNIDRLQDIRTSLGDDKPWWANETAVTSAVIGEIPQAEMLFQKFLFSWARGSIGYNWYNLRSKGTNPRDGEHNYGLVTWNFEPKPAYVTYNMLANYYRGGSFIRDVDLGTGIHGYLFRDKDGDYLLANWNSTRAGANGNPVVISGITGNASVVDLWGNETPLPVHEGSVILQVHNTPTTLRIEAQEQEPVIVGTIMRSSTELLLEKNREKSFEITLVNPSPQTMDFSLRFHPADGVTIYPTEQKATLAPGREKRIHFKVGAAENAQITWQKTIPVKLDLDIRHLWRGELNYKAKLLTLLPENTFSEQPQFVLDQAGQIVSLVVNEPSNAAYFWKGPNDLSGKVWLAVSNRQLLLKAVVKDDVHSQPHKGTEIWNGDSIQFALSIPSQSRFWEIGLARLDSGQPEVYVWQAPRGYSENRLAAAIALKTQRNEETQETLYEAAIPLQPLGINQDAFKNGISFNLLMNDNDGSRRESFITIAPGLGDTKTSEGWPTIATEQQ